MGTLIKRRKDGAEVEVTKSWWPDYKEEVTRIIFCPAKTYKILTATEEDLT